MDDTDLLVDGVVLTEADFARIDVGNDDLAGDLLLDRLDGQRGWVIPLEPDEKVITDAFAVTGYRRRSEQIVRMIELTQLDFFGGRPPEAGFQVT